MIRLSLAALTLGLVLSPLAAAQQEIPADTEIVELPSGLKYSVLKAGAAGASPKMTDSVTVHYTGWFEDGKVFDSSREPRQPGMPVAPATFKVGGVVEGWNEALQLMTPGARWKLTIPSDLGYGDEGRPGIPGGATLIFDVELISFEPGPGLPKFQRPDPATATKLDCGALLKITEAGTGDPLSPNVLTIFHYTVYSPDGERLGSSLFGPQAQKAVMKDVRYEFLQQAAAKLAAGGQAFIEVPADAHPTAEEDTVWHLMILNKRMPELGKVPWKQHEGLEFHVLKEGGGEAAKAGDMVTCHYTGWRAADGVLFDSSAGADPATFPLRYPGGVIEGWVKGVPLVKVGGTILLKLPAELAYGADGRGAMIPGGAALVFEIELRGRSDG